MATLDVLAERLDNHIKTDDTTHGRLLREVSEVKSGMSELSTKVEVLNATLGPVIEHYMAEHPSKVQSIPSLDKTPAKRRPMSQEIKVLGALFTFLTVASQVLQAYLTHR